MLKVQWSKGEDMYFLKYQVPCHQGSPCFYVDPGSQGSIQSGVKHGSLILALLIVCSVALCKLFKFSWSLPAFIILSMLEAC